MRTDNSDSNQRYPHELGGLCFAFGHELTNRKPLSPTAPDHSALAAAIREQWPTANPAYWRMIERRYRELFEGLNEDDAVKAVRANFSSPISAMQSRVIRKCRYRGFVGSRAS